MYSVNSRQKTLHAPLLIDAATREVFVKKTDLDGNEEVVSLGSLFGKPAVPEIDGKRTLLETGPYLKGPMLSLFKDLQDFKLANQHVANTVPEDDWEIARHEARQSLRDSTSTCDENARAIRVENLPLPIRLFVDNQSLSDRSFDLLTSLLKRIKLEDFQTIETAVSCLKGFDKRYLGFVPRDDTYSRFDLDGFLYFESPSGKQKIMYFRLVEYFNFDQLFKDIQGRPDFDERLRDLRTLRNTAIDSVYSSSIHK